MSLSEPLEGLFEHSRWVTLDLIKITNEVPDDENIYRFFERLQTNGLEPRSAENRQAFNDSLLGKAGVRYLVSGYGEDRSEMLKGSEIAKQGRTIHLGVDIFCKELETIYTPCDGEIVEVGYESENHSFGNFVILKPDDASLPYLFFGHLSNSSKPNGHVKAGDSIGSLGDYQDNENGGWSRHLHLQCFAQLPRNAQERIGYLSKKDFESIGHLYPNAMELFPNWQPKKS